VEGECSTLKEELADSPDTLDTSCQITGLDSVTPVDVRCHHRERLIPQTEMNFFKEGAHST